MEIKERTYDVGIRQMAGEYIHRHYLPEQYQDEIQPQDLRSIAKEIHYLTGEQETPDLIRAMMLEGPCIIRYQREHITKEIPSELMPGIIEACMNYHQDKWEFNLSEEDSRRLITMNDRLRILERDLSRECNRLNLEYHARINKGAAFLEDYEIDVRLHLMMDETHPLFREDDDAVLYEHWPIAYGTVRPDGWNAHIEDELKTAARDWNDARNATSPLIRENPLFQASHCWLFHELFDHSPVPPIHICRIDSICVDIKIEHQSIFLVG